MARKIMRANGMMQRFEVFDRFRKDASGATAIEYALISSLIALALVAALSNLGTALSGEFSEVSAALK